MARGIPADSVGINVWSAFVDVWHRDRPERGVRKLEAVLAQFAADRRDTVLTRASAPAVHSVLGKIALAEGRPLVALEEFRRADRILQRLGELYEAKANRAKAIEYYGRFVELWRNADPELQPRVVAVRRRIESLQQREPVTHQKARSTSPPRMD